MTNPYHLQYYFKTTLITVGIISTTLINSIPEGIDKNIKCPKIEDIISSDAKVCDTSIGDYLFFQKNLIEKLRKIILDNNKDDGLKAKACFLIGEMRDSSEPVINALISIIEKDFIGDIKDIPYGKTNPADALIKIGKPVVSKLLEVIAKDKNEMRRYTALCCIWAIEGKKIALILLEDAIAGNKDVIEQLNLKKTVEQIKTQK